MSKDNGTSMPYVANRELCKELYGLSGWDGTEWWRHSLTGTMISAKEKVYQGSDVPAYDLGYLLRKLPSPADFDADHCYREFDCSQPEYLFLGYMGRSQSAWSCQYQVEEYPIEHLMAEADTPEDAAASLAIVLFKQGVLTNE